MAGKKNKPCQSPKVLGIASKTKIRFLTWMTWEYLGIYLFLLKGCISLLKVQLTLSQMQRKRLEQNHINCLIFSLQVLVFTQSLVLEIQHLSSDPLQSE